MDFQVVKASEKPGGQPPATPAPATWRARTGPHSPVLPPGFPALPCSSSFYPHSTLFRVAWRKLSVISSEISERAVPALFSGQIPYKVVLTHELRQAEEAYQAALQRHLDSLNADSVTRNGSGTSPNLRRHHARPYLPLPLAARLGTWGGAERCGLLSLDTLWLLVVSTLQPHSVLFPSAPNPLPLFPLPLSLLPLPLATLPLPPWSKTRRMGKGGKVCGVPRGMTLQHTFVCHATQMGGLQTQLPQLCFLRL